MTYEYVCLACHHEWEAEQSISADPLTDCPKCHAAKAKRMVSGGAGFILKGGGWYADGYGSSSGSSKGSNAAKETSKESKESTSSESSGDTKKDAKKSGDAGGSGSNSKGNSAAT